MTAKEFARKIDGKEWPFSLDADEKRIARESGIYVLVGEWDGLMELHGAERAEFEDRVEVLFDPDNGMLLQSACEFDDCPNFLPLKDKAVKVVAYYDPLLPETWRFQTDIPHHTFMVLEDGEDDQDIHAEGIVFDRGAIVEAARRQTEKEVAA